MEFCWSFLFGFWVDRWSSAGVSCLCIVCGACSFLIFNYYYSVLLGIRLPGFLSCLPACLPACLPVCLTVCPLILPHGRPLSGSLPVEFRYNKVRLESDETPAMSHTDATQLLRPTSDGASAES